MARPKGASGGRGKKAFKDPNKPKRAMSAYFFFMQAYRAQCKSENKDTSKVAEFTKEASALWQKMDDAARKKYVEQSSVAKKEYERQMKSYVPPKGMKMKRVKDPNKPKRPPTSYILFLNDFREANKDKLSHKDVMIKAGEKWRDMGPSDKKPYEERAQAEKRAYDIKVNGGVPVGAAPAAAPPAPMEEEEEEDDEEEEEEEEEEESDE